MSHYGWCHHGYSFLVNPYGPFRAADGTQYGIVCGLCQPRQRCPCDRCHNPSPQTPPRKDTTHR